MVLRCPGLLHGPVRQQVGRSASHPHNSSVDALHCHALISHFTAVQQCHGSFLSRAGRQSSGAVPQAVLVLSVFMQTCMLGVDCAGIEELDMPGWTCNDFVRDFPVDYTLLLENLMDPDHVRPPRAASWQQLECHVSMEFPAMLVGSGGAPCTTLLD